MSREVAYLVVDASGAPDLRQLLQALPRTGYAVVLTGLPEGAGALAGELSGEAARDGITIAPDRVYVCPPGARASVEHGLLRLSGVDTTELESRQRMLVDELNHRVRNMLTVIGAIAKQTLVRTDSPERFTEAFLGRLQAMANAYNLIAKAQWGRVALLDILKSELAAISEARIMLEGPEVTFDPPKTVALGLVVHELVSNATRHGALMATAGRLSVGWHVADGQLALRWRELGATDVAAPERRGFGLQLVERQVASTFDGKTTWSWTPDGLHADISMPVPSRDTERHV